jgi:hypothetical protein
MDGPVGRKTGNAIKRKRNKREPQLIPDKLKILEYDDGL